MPQNPHQEGRIAQDIAAPEAAGLQPEAIDPFQPHPAEGLRRALNLAGEEVEQRADPGRHRAVLRAVPSGDEALLERVAEGDQQNVGAVGLEPLEQPLLLFRRVIAVGDDAEAVLRIALRKLRRRTIGNARPAAEQRDMERSLLRGEEGREEVRAVQIVGEGAA